MLRYARVPSNLPASCDGCGESKKFDMNQPLRHLSLIEHCTLSTFSSSCLTSSADLYFFAHHHLRTGKDIMTVEDDFILHNHTSRLSCLQLHLYPHPAGSG